MTEVAFHFNVPDKLSYACRLVRKAYGSGARLLVTAEPTVLAELDQMLWTFSANEFLPHCRASAPAETVANTPILLSEVISAQSSHDVLVNLGPGVPQGFERFKRFVEVVTHAEDERAAARQRWKYYAERGYSLVRHDLAAVAAERS